MLFSSNFMVNVIHNLGQGRSTSFSLVLHYYGLWKLLCIFVSFHLCYKPVRQVLPTFIEGEVGAQINCSRTDGQKGIKERFNPKALYQDAMLGFSTLWRLCLWHMDFSV